MSVEKQHLQIDDIPAILWGKASGSLFIAVHGDQSSKDDTVIQLLAEAAAGKGHQTLSLDLPEHGARREEARLCNPQNCTADLRLAMAYARARWDAISLFGCSIGAYFSMLAYQDAPVRQALFLSPVVSMQRLIENLMAGFGVSAETLREKQAVATPVKTLYWDYYQYTLAHPVEWHAPTALLYGTHDAICARDDVEHFAARTAANLTLVEGGEHFFHTEQQLALFQQWLRTHISPP